MDGCGLNWGRECHRCAHGGSKARKPVVDVSSGEVARTTSACVGAHGCVQVDSHIMSVLFAHSHSEMHLAFASSLLTCVSRSYAAHTPSVWVGEYMSVEPGLCGGCLHCQVVRSGKGSVFFLCQRHREDARFAKYPRVPVFRCAGFEASSTAVSAAADPSDANQ